MNRKQSITSLKDVEKLLSRQTVIILNAVDQKLERLKKEMAGEVNELRISIDKFVTLYTKQEQEFTIMKEEVRKIKEVIKEKLGVEISVT